MNQLKQFATQKNISFAVIDGNLTNDPELKTIASGKKLSTFSLAINHESKDEGNDVSFIDVEVWDKNAENCSEYLKKGRKVTILGTLKQDRWKSADGTSRNKWKVVASTVRFDGFGDKASNKEREYEKKAA